MARKLKKPADGTKLPIRAEDKAWKDWFSKLKKEDHEQYLAKLGLDDEDIGEFEEDFGFKKKSKDLKKKK